MASALCSESKYNSRAARLNAAGTESQLWLPVHAARTLVPEEQLDRFHMATAWQPITCATGDKVVSELQEHRATYAKPAAGSSQ